MEASGILSTKPHKTSRGVTKSLASAGLEWMLIFFLLVDAIFSFLITKFAHYFELQTPCLLCSRLDHVLGCEKLGYYWDLICGNHKSEISSLVLCHAHEKLVDVHGMCETCFFSFATTNKSNAETYRLLVGKFGKDPISCFDQDPLLDGNEIFLSNTRYCSCCNKPWVAQKLIHTKSIGSEAAELDVPLSGPVGLNQDDLKMRREEPSVLVRDTHLRNSGLDPLSHVGYTELKITSDTESEPMYSDDDDACRLLHETTGSKEDLSIRQLHPCIITLADDSATEKLINPNSAPETCSSLSLVQLDSIEPHDGTSVELTFADGNGLKELNWQLVESKAYGPEPTELISLDDVPPSSNAMESPAEVLKESLNITRTGEVEQTSVTECVKIYDAGTTPITSSEIGVETKPVSTDTSQQVPNLLDLSDAYKIAVSNRGRQLSGLLVEQWMGKDSSRFSEDFKILLSQLSNTCGIEQSMNDKSPRLSVNSDELKISDASNSIGMQIPQKKISLELNESGVSLDGSALQKRIERNESGLSLDGSILQKRMSLERNESGLSLDGSILQKWISLERNESGLSVDGATLQKRISLERNESGLSLDGSIVSEIEGESMVDRLKRQVEHDRKHMRALYKELEEERNASAIAVNQAMAMITKLQEEKATLHMEALQSLRLMEGQSVYDVEALQNANDLLTEKEKEIQDLEAEVEFYRNKFPDESTLENVVEKTCDMNTRDIGVDHLEPSCIEDSATASKNLVTGKPNIYDEVEGTGLHLGNKDTGTVKNSLLEFDEDRLYILQSLKKLEKKLTLFSDNAVYLDLANGEYSQNEGEGESEIKESNSMGESQENKRIKENDLSMQHDVSVSKGNLNAQAHVSSFENPQSICKDNSEFDCSGQGSPVLHRGTDLASLGNEVSDLNGRLEALEADQTFLEHTINSLGNGEEGLQLIREITSHLRELRRIGIKSIDQTTA